ncbi:hypothetical protein BK126_03120 [Paenibacillus sp. FSL H7-0326]|uniref:hypothetical protein n=1 Tax=Paenibacillus sp. FSL H7-0326 TaxID=1921144 RepID=UPI00096C9493|nr:hypothetical protein [Paenibacillus sp. FSL H7-0326]OMC71119.1 hypothetical protein BK126_03120 [Paenibacillus sp. FSL H7-0326]
MRIYITPQQYDTAEANGINKKLVDNRVKIKGWSIEDAITRPVRDNTALNEWVLKALSNGITRQCYYNRVHKYKWSKEKASTTPMMNPQEVGRLGQAAYLRNKAKNEGAIAQ